MSDTFAADELFSAACKGHVKDLNLLVKFAGLDVSEPDPFDVHGESIHHHLLASDDIFPLMQKNLCDFDMRTSIHRAAKDGRLLAVSYLLGIAADPNLKDRWGCTALDLALQGQTLYHMFVNTLEDQYSAPAKVSI